MELDDASRVRARDPYSFLPTLGELDLHLVGEGRHQELWERLGAHPREIDGAAGTSFAVWAPSARSVSVVGDWNGWDGRVHPMRSLGSSGVWELFVPGVERRRPLQVRDPRRRRVAAPEGRPHGAAPPSTRRARPPRSSVSRHPWRDGDWMAARPGRRPHAEPVSIYEVHLPSWRWNPDEGNRPLTYASWARSWATTPATWASRTWSCCR